MPWLVGLDEAGYGPNLGPLVQASTACRVEGDDVPCLWTRLAAAVRRRSDAADDRLLIDDSKKVNEGPHGLRNLEAGVRAADPSSTTIGECVEAWSIGTCAAELSGEPWFDPAEPVPLDGHEHASDTLLECADSVGVAWGPIRALITPAPRFNRLLDEWKNKSGVLATGVVALLRAALHLPGDEPIRIAVDKLGGRHFYAPMLSEAFPDGWPRALCEGPLKCEYVIEGLGREVRITFEPRADGTHLNVALASMVAKYLREACMRQFNRYWAGRLPGLKPTAGYPTDAGRFFDSIRGTLTADGTPERHVWRAK